MTDSERSALRDPDALALLAFLITSAEGCLKEPPLYGVFRLSTAAVKLAASWESRADPETAHFLRDLISRWDAEANLLAQDPHRLKTYLEASAIAVAREIQRRHRRDAHES
jgi:hypothetical protein